MGEGGVGWQRIEGCGVIWMAEENWEVLKLAGYGGGGGCRWLADGRGWHFTSRRGRRIRSSSWWQGRG